MIKKDYILITGSSGLIGDYISKRLLELNYNLLLVDVNSSKLAKQKRRLNLKSNKSKVIFLKKDISKEKSIIGLLNLIKQKKLMFFH